MARYYSEYQSEDYVDSPGTFRMFPSRYDAPLSDGRGEGREHMFSLISPYLNSYALPTDSMNLESGAGEMFRRLYGNRLYMSVEPRSLRDLIRLFVYETGLFSADTLSYYLGISDVWVTNFVSADMNRQLNLVRYKGEPDYTRWYYYVYRPSKEPYCSYGFSSPVDYADKTLSVRSIPHTYSIGLSQLLMRLYCVARPLYYMEFSSEVPLGNFGYTAPGSGKVGSEVTADGFLTAYRDGETIPKVLILEQDMGTEPFSVLMEKLKDYGATSFFTADIARDCAIVLSCHKVCAADKRLAIGSTARYVALYLCLCAYVSSEYMINILDSDNYDVFSILSACNGVGDAPEFMQEADSAYYVNYCRGFFDIYGEDGLLFGISSIDSILSELAYIKAHGQQVLSELLCLMGCTDYKDRFLCDSITLGEIRSLLVWLSSDSCENDILMRLRYNQERYAISRMRHIGYADAMLDVMHGKRCISKKATASKFDESMYFAPIYAGYSIYTCPSVLLTNYMAGILWDKDSAYIQRINRCLDSYFADISSSYLPLSDYLDISSDVVFGRTGVSYPFRLRNYYYSPAFGEEHMAAGVRICLEDIDSDTGAYIRACMFIAGYCGNTPIKLILLVDSVYSALEFYRKHLVSGSKKFIVQSDSCTVRLFDEKMQKGFMDMTTSGILFMEKGIHKYTKDQLFAFNDLGQIVYMTP